MVAERTDPVVLQDHKAFLARAHDFQADIETFADSELVGTILETVMMATGMRFAAVARVTADRWVACRTVDEVEFGLQAGDEIEIRSTFCQSVRDTAEKVLFNDSTTDEIYAHHPIAVKFGIASYASIPIYRSDGSFFGTLCAIDREPRDIKHPRAVKMLEMFADIIGQSLEAAERLEAQEHNLEHERRMTQVQEEFVAVLGHDLRNPVAAFGAGLRQLEREPQSDRARTLLPLMKSSLYRMNELIDNVMLHARSRLGAGIRIDPVSDAPLARAITQVVDEIQVVTPERQITLELALDRPVRCDPARIAQAVSNLVSNAVRHGSEGHPIVVHGHAAGDHVAITVANHGAPIPDESRAELFTPFRRGADAEGMSLGLGLGLHIAASIAQAHGGDIGVTCRDGITAFEIRLPLAPA
ncbi:GAF domain-containing sensor histidine kinase [Pseudoponticoccus marisrubri]|uniref:histidine kinase n=1 Tax=Pseudoponticoccus marisrubri TaxID=1685382 RepID=A0A0W7WJT0_9RHOB|nr:GAF domain-containing sensor histidine kinase [Pseudoponticoccus marisrubri]KUF10876.1 histidine kinase [Pseudoponticoccus marisrubri]